jgi:ribonucleoside-triphosphate reductase
VHGYLDGEHEFCPKCDEALLQKQQSCDVIAGDLPVLRPDRG